mgnify:FL=1
MTTDIDRRLAIVPGSLADIASAGKQSVAQAFVGVEVVIIVDTSGSMDSRDSTGERSRYDVACEHLAELQTSLPGRVAVIAFSDTAAFCPNGIPMFLGGRTDMTGALQFAKIADAPGVRFIVISDGEPDNSQTALQVAATYRNRIDTIYVGPEYMPYGRDFLQRLAAASGGQSVVANRATNLLGAAQRLLTVQP